MNALYSSALSTILHTLNSPLSFEFVLSPSLLSPWLLANAAWESKLTGIPPIDVSYTPPLLPKFTEIPPLAVALFSCCSEESKASKDPREAP